MAPTADLLHRHPVDERWTNKIYSCTPWHENSILKALAGAKTTYDERKIIHSQEESPFWWNNLNIKEKGFYFLSKSEYHITSPPKCPYARSIKSCTMLPQALFQAPSLLSLLSLSLCIIVLSMLFPDNLPAH